MFESKKATEALDRANAALSVAHLAMLNAIREVDRCDAWIDEGARDLTHWLSMRYDITTWKARRWIGAANAMPGLPLLARALASGRLGIDKVVELARFVTPADEGRWLSWAEGVSARTIRRRGDVVSRELHGDASQAMSDRRLVWWYTDEGRFAFEGEMPGAQGAVVADTLDRLAEAVPIMPGEEAMNHRDARRADALWALCSGHRASEHEPGRSCIVVHARLDELRNGGGGEVHCGPAVSAPTLERLACDARLELVIEDEAGDPIRVARGRRIPPPWLVRQIRHRDRGCRFPGCGSEAFTQVHHVRWWSRGGRTEAKNLILLCGFHHRLLHEAGWSIRLDPRGVPRWLRPDGTPHRSRAPAALPA